MPSHELALESSTPTAPPAEYNYENLGNPDLPIYLQQAEIIDALHNNQVVILIAPTGTGKSTQVPQMAIKAGFDPVRHTQPRRRAATNVAQRVQQELSVHVGEEHAGELVSCHTGGGLVGPYDSRAQIMTEGVLNARDTYQRTDSDNELWILDEAHEEGSEMWLISGIARQKIAENPNFTVAVMTATPNLYETIDAWTTDDGIEPAVVELTGGTNFEIEDREEPESTTAKEAIKAAIDIFENPDDYDGANTIQVQEAGVKDIKDTINTILRDLPAEVRARTLVIPNHAKLTPRAQQPAYEDFDGIKIVVQTNIGRTSVTIPRTRDVITSGVERVIEIDEDDVGNLVKRPTSQSDLKQERGRGGRTSQSRFTHTRHDGEDFVPMADRESHKVPEMLRTNIDSIVLRLAVRGINIRDFDGKPMPTRAAIDRSMHRLQVLGALDEHEQLSRLGERMTKYPVSPEHQRCLVEAEQYNEQTRLRMAAMVAAAEVGGLRLFESGSAMWEQVTDETNSDMLVHLEMFMAIQRRRVNALVKDDLDTNNIVRAEELYRKIAHRSGIDYIQPLKVPSVEDRRILRECIVSGFSNSAYLPAGDGMFKAIGGALNLREISNRSVVSPTTRNAIVGTPYGIEVEKSGVPEIRPLIGNITEVSVRELGKYLVNQTTWRPIGFRLRGGTFVQVEEQLLGRRKLAMREVSAEPSPMLRAAVIEESKVRPGKHLLGLYGIKTELEKLARRSKRPIPFKLLTQDAIDNYIEQSSPDDVNSPDHVEDNLRQIIEDNKITLDSFASAELRQKIRSDAPDEIQIDGFTLKLQYSNGKPTVRRTTIEMILGLQDEPMLADGRQVLFMYDDKPHTMQQLRKRMLAAGEL